MFVALLFAQTQEYSCRLRAKSCSYRKHKSSKNFTDAKIWVERPVNILLFKHFSNFCLKQLSERVNFLDWRWVPDGPCRSAASPPGSNTGRSGFASRDGCNGQSLKKHCEGFRESLPQNTCHRNSAPWWKNTQGKMPLISSKQKNLRIFWEGTGNGNFCSFLKCGVLPFHGKTHVSHSRCWKDQGHFVERASGFARKKPRSCGLANVSRNMPPERLLTFLRVHARNSFLCWVPNAEGVFFLVRTCQIQKGKKWPRFITALKCTITRWTAYWFQLSWWQAGLEFSTANIYHQKPVFCFPCCFAECPRSQIPLWLLEISKTFQRHFSRWKTTLALITLRSMKQNCGLDRLKTTWRKLCTGPSRLIRKRTRVLISIKAVHILIIQVCLHLFAIWIYNYSITNKV